MGLEWNLWPLHKRRYFLAIFFASLVLVSLSFYLFFSLSGGTTPVSECPAIAQTVEVPVDVTDGGPQKEECDLFMGEWIPNPSGPAYSNDSCRLIQDLQNCMKNGRPDTGYLYWRWKPKGCDLPVFDAERFLDSVRCKSWGFIGDSISRNHVQSLLCLLSKVEEPIEVYHDAEFRSKRWYFSSYNFTLSVVWSPLLLRADIFEGSNGSSSKIIQLHLDTLDQKWTAEYQNFDYIVTSGGKWFLKSAIYWENNRVVGCHNCPGKNLTELGIEYAYRKAIRLVLHFYATSCYRGLVIFRTSTPDHFENGEWFSGGICNRTVPFKGGEVTLEETDRKMWEIEQQEFKRAAAEGSKNGARMKLMDTTYLSLLRPDGHPGPYRRFHPSDNDKNAKVQNDCLHWCLPGPIDSWNDLFMRMVLGYRKIVV